MQIPRFLSNSQVIAIHLRQVDRFGGTAGIRDNGLLDSALAQPQATFGGELLHHTIHEQAAAYLFHLVKNHPFVDGNKRTGFAVAIAFLALNGYNINLSEEEAYNLVMQVAQGEITKEKLSADFQAHLQQK